jgi:hypothetical protein
MNIAPFNPDPRVLAIQEPLYVTGAGVVVGLSLRRSSTAISRKEIRGASSPHRRSSTVARSS